MYYPNPVNQTKWERELFYKWLKSDKKAKKRGEKG